MDPGHRGDARIGARDGRPTGGSLNDEQIARLTQRVYDLEREVAELNRRLGAPRPPKREADAPVTPTVAQPSPTTAADRPREVPVPLPATTPRDEADVLGAWFARTGAVVLLIGFGFAFKYAIDRGIIGPTGRVALGLAGGLVLVASAEWAMRRGWPAWAQAVAGAGVALSYLSILAAVQLYDLIDPTPAFACLVLITAVGGFLAIRHNSVVLALLATVGGYLNAVILATETPRPLAVFVYLLALQAGVLGLAFLRRWRALDAAALAGTVIVFALTVGDATFAAALAFSTLYFVVFAALPIVRAFRTKIDGEDLALLAVGAFLYFGYAAVLFDDNGFANRRGALALAMGVAHVALGFGMRNRNEQLSTGLLALGMAFGALFVPFQFRGNAIPAGWAVEGTLLIWAGSHLPVRRFRIIGAVLMTLSLYALLQLSNELAPDRLLLSDEAAALATEIAALGVAAWLLARDPAPLPRESAVVAVLAALAVALGWISLEVTAELDRSGVTDQAKQFSLSAVWGSFAAALLALGVRFRARWIRMAGVALFAVVLAKLVLADLWTLSTSYRFMAFVGLGVVLLICSLGYYRFRDYLTGTEAD